MFLCHTERRAHTSESVLKTVKQPTHSMFGFMQGPE